MTSWRGVIQFLTAKIRELRSARSARRRRPWEVMCVDDVPDNLMPRAVYLVGGTSARPWGAAFKCPCNCGDVIVLPTAGMAALAGVSSGTRTAASLYLRRWIGPWDVGHIFGCAQARSNGFTHRQLVGLESLISYDPTSPSERNARICDRAN